MAEFRILNEKTGRFTHGNPVTLPSGNLSIGKNWECVRDNVYRKPRGRASYGTGLPNANVEQFLSYKNRLFAHMSNSTLYYDSNGTGTFSQKTGTFSSPETGYKIKSIEAAGNLYFTSSGGIQKLESLSSTVRAAGIPQALGFDARLITGTWFTDASAVAYRIVWSYYDYNSNKVIGAPSERTTIVNQAGGTRATSLRVIIPAGITSEYYLEIYRSSIVADTVVPAEDLQLVYQAHPTPAEITGGLMVVADVLPEGFRGADLYTNTTQEGIQKAKAQPPKANCITKYKDYAFYANIESLQRLYTNMVAVADLVAATSTVTLTNGTDTLTLGCVDDIADKTISSVANNAGLCEITTTANHGYTSGDYVRFLDVTGVDFPAVVNENVYAVTVTALDKFTIAQAWVATYTATGGTCQFYEDVGATPRFIISGDADVAVAVDETAKSLVHTINLASGNSSWYAYYVSNYDDVVGKIMITSRSLGASEFWLEVNNSVTSAEFSPPIPWTSSVSTTANAGGLVRITTAAAHGLSSGDHVKISAVGGTVEANGADWTITVVNTTQFTLTGSAFVNAHTGGGVVEPKGYSSVNDDFSNAIMWSEPQENEAVPLINIKRIGSADDPIVDIVGLKDSIFIIKQKDGVWRMTGEAESGFSFDEFDGTVECAQKNTIAKGQNAIYMFTTLGYSKVSDIGVEVIGRANEFKDLIPRFSTNFETDGYGWFYEEEKSYFVATHSATTSTSNDIVNVYNTFTDSWMQREHGVYTNDSHIKLGIVISGIMYTAPITGNGICKERKSFTTTDFSLPDVANTITAIDTVNNQITLGTNVVVPEGSLVIQGASTYRVTTVNTTALLTLATVNNLATNISVAINNCANNGAGLIRVTTAAAHGLVTDNSVTIAGVTGTTEANGNWIIVRIDATNFDLVNSTFVNAYTGGPGTVTNAITIICGIVSTLKYHPIHCGAPEYEKHFKQLITFFDNDETRITQFELVTTTDLDKTEQTTYLFEGVSGWGLSPWGIYWGTPATTDRMSTFLPEEHSRGAYLDVSLIHRRPREQCALCGISVVFDPIDTRINT